MHEIKIPKVNNNDESYVLVEWLAQDGEELAADSPVAVIETSKAAEELVTDQGGILQQAVSVNTDCTIGAVIGRLFPTEQARLEYLTASNGGGGAASQPGDVVITKSAREAAEEFGVGLTELRTLGKKVLKRRDVEEFAARTRQAARSGGAPSAAAVKTAGDGEDTLAADAAEAVTSGEPSVRLSPAQQAVAQVVTRSHESIPAAFMVAKVPIEAALELQADLASGSQLTIGIPELVIKAVAGLRERFRMFFASYRRDGTAELTPGAHVGITLDLGKGLFIPVIEHADTKSLADIADTLADFRISALRGSFQESELAGGNITISLSNDDDIVLARPLIFPGQACMVCLCATQEEVYLASDGVIATRHYVNVGLAYDHRLVNGRDAALFLQELKRIFADPVPMATVQSKN